MFENIKTMYKLAKTMNQNKDLDLKRLKTASSRSGYSITDEDRARSEEVKQYKAEVKKQEFDLKKQELEIEKLQRLQEVEIRREELRSLKDELTGAKDSGGGMEDVIMTQIMNKFLNSSPTTQNPVQPSNLANYMPTEPQPQQPQQSTQELPISRFSDDDLKQQLPKLLNTDQISMLKQLNLTDDELLQLGDVIKTF